jgi:hypothetical protein
LDTTVTASLGPIDVEQVTQADIDELRAQAPNVLISIGYLGGMLCYLNLDLATVLERFRAEFNGAGETADPTEYSLYAIAFEDSFRSYEIRD